MLINGLTQADESEVTNEMLPEEITSLIDLAYLREFSGGDSEFEIEIIQSSIDEMTEKIAELQKVFNTLDKEAICNIAHSLKSLSSIIGSAQLHNYFMIIETSCNVCTVNALQNWITEASELWVRVRQSLLALIGILGAEIKTV